MKFAINILAAGIWTLVVVLAIHWPASSDPNSNFLIVLIGSGAIAGGCRFLLMERFLKP